VVLEEELAEVAKEEAATPGERWSTSLWINLASRCPKVLKKP